MAKDIYSIQIKRGMKFRMTESSPSVKSKIGDVVKVTSITEMGQASNGFYSDYENIRVSNGKFSWRVSRSDLKPA